MVMFPLGVPLNSFGDGRPILSGSSSTHLPPLHGLHFGLLDDLRHELGGHPHQLGVALELSDALVAAALDLPRVPHGVLRDRSGHERSEYGDVSGVTGVPWDHSTIS